MPRFLDLPDCTTFIIYCYILRFHDLQDIARLSCTCKQLHSLLKTFVAQFISHRVGHLIQYNHQLTVRTIYNLFSPKIFIVGGVVNNRKCLLFEPTKGRFHRGIAGIGLKRTDEFDAICYRGLVVVVSGSDDSAIGKVEAYHMDSNSWHLWPSLPRPLVSVSCAVAPNGHIVVSGGIDRSDSRRSQEILVFKHAESKVTLSQLGVSTVAGQWEVCSCLLSKGRSHHGSIVYQNILWMAGGLVTGRMVATNTVEAIQLATGMAINIAPMLRHRLVPRLLVIEGHLYAVGGDVEGTSFSVSSIERYDANRDQWIFVTFFPQPRRRIRCAIAAYGKRIFVFGGSDGPSLLCSWDFFDIQGKYWASQIQSMIEEDPAALLNYHLSTEDLTFINGLLMNNIPTQPNGIKSATAVFVSVD